MKRKFLTLIAAVAAAMALALSAGAEAATPETAGSLTPLMPMFYRISAAYLPDPSGKRSTGHDSVSPSSEPRGSGLPCQVLSWAISFRCMYFSLRQ